MLFIFSRCENVWLGKQLSGVQTAPQRQGEQMCTLVLFIHILFSHKGPGGRVQNLSFIIIHEKRHRHQRQTPEIRET